MLTSTAAHSDLHTFTRTLYNLSHAYNILALLLNGAITPDTSAAAHLGSHATPQPSIFSSTLTRPALGQTFLPVPELHILLSLLPKRRLDAEAVYGEDAQHNKAHADMCCVFEVLRDEVPGRAVRRRGGRVQRWGAFEVRGVRIRGAFDAGKA